MNNKKLNERQFENIYKMNNKKDKNDVGARLSVERNFVEYQNDSEESIKSENSKKEFRGMPSRSQFKPKKILHDANKYLDFNIYDKKINNKNVTLPNNNNDDYADINTSMVQMTQQINPIFIFNKSLETFSSKVNELLYKNINDSFITSSIGIYALFGCLYLISKSSTEHECKKFFNLQDKENYYKSLLKITQSMDKINNMINIKNFFVYGNNIPTEKSYFDNLSNFCTIACVNIKNPEKESQKLSFIINKLMETEMRNPVKPSNIENLQIMLMTFAHIHPKFSHSFSEMNIDEFNGREHKFISTNNRVFHYFEDNDRQIIEIKCGDYLNYGIILHKKHQQFETNDKIHNYIHYLKPTALEEVKIPIFTQNLKFRYINVLKQLGLQSVFMKIFSNAFPEGNVILHDIIQNVKITIDNNTYNLPNDMNGVKSIRNFIVDKPFLYYFRLLKTNTIILNGKYE